MNYFEKFTAQSDKLANIMDANDLLHTFNTKTYPITLTITQNQAPDAQLSLLENAPEEGVSSQDARLVLTFPVGEIGVRVYGRLVIADTLMAKIMNHGKKMRDLWLQGYFAAQMANGNKSNTISAPGDTEDEQADGDFDEFYEDDADTADEVEE